MMSEYLELDQLTLGEISVAAGNPIDEEAYLKSLEEAKSTGCLFDVRKDGILRAYATLKDLGGGKWFVLMFVTHPQWRTKHTFTELFGEIISHLEKVNAKTLVSNVFKVNKPSIAFHMKIGFNITREAPHGYEFTLDLDSPEAINHRLWTRKSACHCRAMLTHDTDD